LSPFARYVSSTKLPFLNIGKFGLPQKKRRLLKKIGNSQLSRGDDDNRKKSGEGKLKRLEKRPT